MRDGFVCFSGVPARAGAVGVVREVAPDPTIFASSPAPSRILTFARASNYGFRKSPKGGGGAPHEGGSQTWGAPGCRSGGPGAGRAQRGSVLNSSKNFWDSCISWLGHTCAPKPSNSSNYVFFSHQIRQIGELLEFLHLMAGHTCVPKNHQIPQTKCFSIKLPKLGKRLEVGLLSTPSPPRSRR